MVKVPRLRLGSLQYFPYITQSTKTKCGFSYIRAFAGLLKTYVSTQPHKSYISIANTYARCVITGDIDPLEIILDALCSACQVRRAAWVGCVNGWLR